MGRQPRPMPFLLFLFWLGTSWEAHVPHRVIPSNATVFSHIYTIKLKGDGTEDEGSSSAPQEALGPPGSSRGGGLYEHTLEGPDQEHVVFTHRINLPQQSCGCPPGTEDTQDLLRRLQALENEVRSLRDTCQAGGGCCPATSSSQASTGQTDTRTLCSNHGSFDLSRCLCECEAGWSGPTCAEPTCPGGCGGPQRGKCANGRCQCRPGYSGARCEEPPSCPDDCNDQGRCVDGRCACFPGYSGPSCADPACPQDCQGRGRCVDGQCVCDPGYSGPDCGSRACPSNCNRRGECHNGRCVCEPGFTGPACGTKACPNDCNQRGRCLKGAVCACHKGYTGPDCGQLACPEDCSGRGECQNGVCICHDGYSGEDCSIEIPSIGIHVKNRDETSFRLEWNRPEVSVDAYEIHVKPTRDQQAGESVRLSGTETGFERRGLTPGEEYTVTVRAEKGQRYGPPVTQTVRTRVAPPRGLQSSQVTENSMTLEWEPPASRPDGYILSYVPLVASRPAQAVKRVELPAAPESVTLDELESSTRYRITMFARQSGENSRATSIIVSTTAPGPPSAAKTQTFPRLTTKSPEVPLRDLTVTDISPDSLRVTWSAPPSSFRSFSLQYRDPKSSAPPGEIRVPGTERSVTVMGLTPRTEYELELSGEKPDGSYNPPLTTKTSTAPAPALEKPTLGQLSVSDVKENSARLSWDVPTGTFDSFLIQYKDAEGKPKSLPVDGGSQEVTIYDLAPSRKYKFSLYGLVGRKRHGPVSTEMVTGKVPAPEKKPEREVTAPPGLGELSASDITSSSVRLSWSVPSGRFDSFLVQYKDAEGRPQVLPMEGDSREVTIPSLAPSRKYRFNLYGISSRKRLGPATADVTTASRDEEPVPEPEPEPVLGDLLVSDATSNSVRLTWSVPTGSFDSFFVQYKDSEGNDQALTVDQHSREATVLNLVPSQRYRFFLYGISGPQRLGPVSADATTAPLPTTPAPQPSLGELSVLDVTTDSVRLSWTVPTGNFDSFLVQYKDAEGKPQALPVDGSSREVTVSNLVPSRRYKFNLYGVSGRKRLGPVSTDTVTASLPKEPSIAPSLGELSASDATSNSVRLSWTVPTGSFDSFLIQYKDAEGKPQAIPVEGAFRETVVPNLVPSRRYKFNLYGLTGRKRLGPISTDATTASSQEQPTPPSLGELSASDATSDSIRLSWTVPTGNFDSFLIQYKDAEGKPQAIPVEGAFRETIVPNLVPSRRYKFNLYGLTGRKRHGPISTDATTAAVGTPPGATTEKVTVVQLSLDQLSVSDITSDSARLSWTVPTGNFDSFLVEYEDADGRPQALPVDGASRTLTVPNLEPSHRYTFNLYGLYRGKRYGPLAVEAVTAAVGTPPKATTEKVTVVQLSLDQLSVSDITSDSARLSWTVPTGNFDSFLVEYEDADGRPQALPVDGASRTLTVPNLEPSHRYTFNLYGLYRGKRYGPLPVEAVTAAVGTPPKATTEKVTVVQLSLDQLSVSDITSDSARLSWTVPTGNFDSFLVEYEDADGRPQALPVDGASRTLTVPNLEPSHRYTFNLYGLYRGKRYGPLAVEAVTAAVGTPPKATTEKVTVVQLSLDQLSVSDITSDSARLSWTVPTGNFDSFLVEYEDADGRPQALPVDGASRTLTVPNLEPSHRYTFNLYGLYRGKRYGPLPVEAVTASAVTTPPQPTLGELSAVDVSSDSLRLSWTVPTGNFDSFLVQYKDAEGRPQALPVDGGSREVTISSLLPSRRYKFNLYGISGRKRIGPISTSAVTDQLMVKPTPALKLGELTAGNAMPNSLDVSWTVEAGDFDSFIIQYQDAQGKPQVLPVDGRLRSLHLHDLAPSHRYQINLYGVLGRKRLGPISTEAETAPLPTTPAPQPSLGELSVSDVTTDSVRLSWTVPIGSFDSFLVQYKDAEGKPQALPVDGASREVTVSSLVPSRRYKFNLYGVSGRKRLGPVSTDTVTAVLPTTPAPQPSLGELSALDITTDSIRLSWTVPTGNFDSFLIQYKDAEGKPQAIPVEGAFRETIVPNLVPSRRYKFNLYGLTGRKRHGPISTDATTVAELLAAPTLGELSVSDVTSESARLSWTVLAGRFDSFLVQYKDAEGKPQQLPLDGGTYETTISGLSPARRYKFNLYGIVGRKRLGPVSADTVTAAAVSGEGPAKPSLEELSVSEVTSNSALLSWTVPTGDFDSFLIQYKDAEGKPQALTVEGVAREVTVPNLVPSHRYKFNLYGVVGRRRLGPISSEATTAEAEEDNKEGEDDEDDGESEPSLGQLSVSEANSNSIRLSWSVPTGNFDSFLVQYEDGEDELQTMPVDGGSREVTVSNLSPSQRYRFDLYGLSGGERLGPVSTDASTAPLTPVTERGERGTPPPGSDFGQLSASDVTSDSVRLSWDVPSGIFDSFLVQYKDADNKPQALPVDKETNSVVIYYLVPSYRYKFNLFGLSGRRRFGPISVIVVTATQLKRDEVDAEDSTGREPRLGQLSVSEVTSNAARLSWSVPEGSFDSFSVQYRDAEGKPQALPVGGGSREVIVSNLVPSHKYKFNLYGISGNQRLGPISATAEMTGTQPGALTQLKFGELSAHDITPESVLLSWTVETGNFDSFIIQYRDADGNPHALPVDGGMRSLRLHDLVPSHKYRFNLYGISGRKRLGPISTEATTAASEQPAPPKPSLGELSASDITSTTVRLSWSVQSGDFDSFIIQYRDAEGKPQALPVDKDSRNVIVSGLVPSRKYKFNLFGISGRKRLGPISTEAVTAPMVKTEVHPTLGDLSISEVTQGTVRLSWTISAGKFDSFLIQYKDTEGKLQAVPVDADSRTVVIKDLTTSHRYKFNLYGISGRKRHGPISIDAVTASPEASKLVFLENLVVSEVTPTTLQLTWEAPEGEFDFFSVQRKISVPDSEMSPTPTKKINVTGDERSVVFRGLSPNTEYSLTVYGIQDGSEAASINTVATTSGTELDSPRDLLFNDIRETSVVANWRSPSSRVDGYKVSFQPSDGGEPRSISVDGSKLRTTIEGLTPGASYEVTVMSVRGFEESEPLVGYVTTVPDGPSNLRAIDVTDSSAVLTWQPAVAEMNNYIVTYGPAGGARASESVPGNRAELQLSGLHLDTEYRASVYGEKGGNRSSPASATFTTGADGPRDLQASEISSRSARLTWLPPRAPPGGYLLTYETPSGQSKEITVDASVTSYELQDLIPSGRYQVQVQALRRGTPTAPTATSFTTGPLKYPFPRDCAEESQNGPGPSRVRTIYLGGNQDRPLQVYCDMETDGGGWIVFQRRMNGETNFWRNWQEYATGFGNLTREFWLGNDALHQLTTSGDYELRVDLRAGNESVYATYQNFRVDPPADHYRLHLGSYSGTAGDAFTYHSGSVFSTKDRDPNRVIIPCAVSYRGAWWYRNCHYANLNGLYANNRDHQGINWFNWKGFEFSIPFTEMKLRPRGFRPLRRV
ncbi:tenascin-X isoform X6 [Podarcis raffonei]|uniref:tenascin-X isoform X6 n=1 Tax=Podarcis raffonei TaxID=65483 RepID=UPI0023293D5A|nr:tenascin-X isoform X6 [Podarcis raffonei]